MTRSSKLASPAPEPAKAPVVIEVRPSSKNRTQGPRSARSTFSARFVGGPHDGCSVSGHLSPEDALGELVRQVVEQLATPDAILSFLASLFGDLSLRSANVILARAVWFTSIHKRRRHPGVRIDSDSDMTPS